MGFSSIKSKSNEQIPRSLLSQVGTGIFDVIDTPGNMTRSLVRYAQTGDTKYLSNIAYNILPGVEAKTIDPEEITGSENFAVNLATGILLDPTLAIGQVGGLTKVGKAASVLRATRSEAKVQAALAKITGAVQDAERTKELFAKASKANKILNELKKVSPATERSIINLGTSSGPGIGDFDKIRQIAAKIRLLPDPRIADINKKLQQLQVSARKAERTGQVNKLEKIESTIDRLRLKVDGLNPGRLHVSPETANKLRDTANKIIGLFRHDPRNKRLKDIIDLTKTNEARDLFDLKEESVLLGERFDALKAKAGNLTEQQYNERVLQGLEARHLRENLPKLDERSHNEILDITKKFKKRYRKEVKAGVYDKATFATDFQNKITAIKGKAVERSLQLDRAKQVLGDLTPEELEFVDEVGSSFERMVPFAQKLGIDLQKLTSSKELTAYAPRVLSTEAKALKRSDKTKYNLILRDLTTRYKNALQRKIYPESDIVGANALIKQDYGINFNFFDTNVVDIISKRREAHILAIHKAAGVNTATELFGRTNKISKGDVRASQLWERTGLDPKKAPKKWIPKEIKEDILGLDTLFIHKADPKGLIAKGLSYVDWMNKFYRLGLTVLFPSFHHRNALSNFITNGIAGDVGFKDYAKARSVQNLAASGKLTQGSSEYKLWREVNQYKIIDAGLSQEYFDTIKNAKFKDLIDKPFIAAPELLLERFGKQLPESTKKALSYVPSGAAYGRFLEDNARIAHYIAKRRKGLSELEAMRSVNKYLFDRNKLTNFERKYAKPSILFYTWLRNNIPLMIKTSISHPRYVSIYNHITETGEDEAPQYLRSGYPFRAPESIFGQNQFIGSLGVPLEDLFTLNTQIADPSGNFIASMDEIGQVGANLLAKTTPIIKAPLELLTGKEFFTGRKLSDMGAKAYINRLLPTSRIVGTYDKAFDEDRSITSRFFDLMTGVRTYGVDPKRVKISNLRRAALATGKIRKATHLEPTNKEDKSTKKILKQIQKAVKDARK